MPEYYTPGVYIVEEPGSKSMEAVGTSTPAFLGEVPNAGDASGSIGVSNWDEFERRFCRCECDVPPDAQGNKVLDELTGLPRLASAPQPPTSLPQVWMVEAIRGFFANGGSYCYVVPVASTSKLEEPLKALVAIDDINLIVAPGRCSAEDVSHIAAHCLEAKYRFAILDAPEFAKTEELKTLVATARDDRGQAALYYPWLEVSNVWKLKASALTGAPPAKPVASPAKPKGVANAPKQDRDKDKDGEEGRAEANPAAGPRPEPAGAAAPMMPVATPGTKPEGVEAPLPVLRVPPSGHIAGIYARNDARRGVFKAPANERVIGALALTHRVSDGEQQILNPEGVNCIRSFAGAGILVWGARTTAPRASEWKYVNVRRLFNMCEDTIARTTRWVVFEPNDVSLWKRIERDVTAFLLGQWRQGALAGTTPSEAFFVKCNAESNPQDEIDRGRVNIIIGLAPVKPAEFVIFRIGHTQAAPEIS